MVIGEGMLRQCLGENYGGCGIIYGCYQPDGEKCDCSKCNDKACPDTQEISNGLCELCFHSYHRNKFAAEGGWKK